jgi:iron(II)-dependent oxidoreductase
MTCPDFRHGDAGTLASLLTALRAQTLAQFDAMNDALGGRLDIAYAEEVNPPLWELGHVGWFEEFWIARNPERQRGAAATVESPRAASLLPTSDALYDSSRVAHTRRWQLALPDVRRARDFLARGHERTLALLRQAHGDDASLYFFRLALAHEAMHQEAGLMIAQGLGLRVPAPDPQGVPPRRDVAIAGTMLSVGADDGGFAFDNELSRHDVEVADFAIDGAPLAWRDWLPFIEAGGYDDARHWTDTGWAWRQRALTHGLPRHVARDDDFEHGLKRAAFGRWHGLALDEPVLHVSAHEAQAWCRWAGRRLPSEHEWTLTAARLGDGFHAGQVWEWTASPFAPWPGFVAHAYRDYSLPWFDGRPVLKGGSFATQPFMKDVRYRNFFMAGRNDVFAGVRSCAL